jgi:ribosomal protein S18 acetylase RimI-like enzyme
MRVNKLKAFRKDQWLSKVLSRPCFQYRPSFRADVRDESRRLLAGTFAYAKVDVTDIGAASDLEEVGFRLADTSLIYSGRLTTEMPRLASVRFARPEDCESVKRIAASSFRFSRFHQDPMILDEDANKIKAEWAANYFRGTRGEWMVVAIGDDSAVVGFLQLLGGRGGELTIDLIAVDERFRGRGAASAMIQYAFRECGSHEKLCVGTQVVNISSIHLYEKIGLHLESAQYIFHWHSGGRK